MSDQELSFVAARSRYSEFREETIFEKRDAAVSEDLRSTAQEVVSRESLMECLNNLELPNGWGTILNSFTETLMGQIRSGLLTAEVFDATTDPILLLLRILLLYGISEHDEAFHSISFRVQTFFDVLKMMGTLRNGGRRLLSRLEDCLNYLLNWNWDPYLLPERLMQTL